MKWEPIGAGAIERRDAFVERCRGWRQGIAGGDGGAHVMETCGHSADRRELAPEALAVIVGRSAGHGQAGQQRSRDQRRCEP